MTARTILEVSIRHLKVHAIFVALYTSLFRMMPFDRKASLIMVEFCRGQISNLTIRKIVAHGTIGKRKISKLVRVVMTSCALTSESKEDRQFSLATFLFVAIVAIFKTVSTKKWPTGHPVIELAPPTEWLPIDN